MKTKIKFLKWKGSKSMPLVYQSDKGTIIQIFKHYRVCLVTPRQYDGRFWDSQLQKLFLLKCNQLEPVHFYLIPLQLGSKVKLRFFHVCGIIKIKLCVREISNPPLIDTHFNLFMNLIIKFGLDNGWTRSLFREMVKVLSYEVQSILFCWSFFWWNLDWIPK